VSFNDKVSWNKNSNEKLSQGTRSGNGPAGNKYPRERSPIGHDLHDMVRDEIVKLQREAKVARETAA